MEENGEGGVSAECGKRSAEFLLRYSFGGQGAVGKQRIEDRGWLKLKAEGTTFGLRTTDY